MSRRFLLPGLLVPVALATAVIVVTPTPTKAQDGSWSALTGLTTPGLRREFGSVFDRRHERFLLFHGFNTTNGYALFNDVWELSVDDDPPAWTELSIDGPVPGPRHSPQWGYDAARNRILLFGGYGSHYPGDPWAYLNDVWELSLNGDPRWRELTPSGTTPSGRLAGAAVFDPMRQRFIGFGGTIGAPVDTWVLDLRGPDNWQPVDVSGTHPNGGYNMSSVYDARADRMLVFGGSLGDSYYGATNDVWELALRDVPTWRKIETSGTPPLERRAASAVFDSNRNRLIIYGGAVAMPGSHQFFDDIWQLDFNGEPTWTELFPAGESPVGRDLTAAAYDPLHDRMIVHGGWSGTQMLGDTQFLNWSQPSDGDATFYAHATATPDAAHLSWDVDAATGNYAAIYRRAPGGEWTALAQVETDANGHVEYEDTTVEPDNDYSYMMVVSSELGETFGGEMTVEIPGTTTSVENGPAAEFALNGVAPNPAVDQMWVSFTLTSTAPASLELLDITGRRLLSREVGSLGAGPQQVQLSTGRQVPPGLYFLQLSQAGRIASSRVAIIRR